MSIYGAMGYPHPRMVERLADQRRYLASYPLDNGRVAMLGGHATAEHMVHEGLPETAGLDRRSVEALIESLHRIPGTTTYIAACASSHTVFLAVYQGALYYWAPFEHTVYFASQRERFAGLLPFGQAPVKLPPSSVIDLTSHECLPL